MKIGQPKPFRTKAAISASKCRTYKRKRQREITTVNPTDNEMHIARKNRKIDLFVCVCERERERERELPRGRDRVRPTQRGLRESDLKVDE